MRTYNSTRIRETMRLLLHIETSVPELSPVTWFEMWVWLRNNVKKYHPYPFATTILVARDLGYLEIGHTSHPGQPIPRCNWPCIRFNEDIVYAFRDPVTGRAFPIWLTELGVRFASGDRVLGRMRFDFDPKDPPQAKYVEYEAQYRVRKDNTQARLVAKADHKAFVAEARVDAEKQRLQDTYAALNECDE